MLLLPPACVVRCSTINACRDSAVCVCACQQYVNALLFASRRHFALHVLSICDSLITYERLVVVCSGDVVTYLSSKRRHILSCR
jgi:hypothetical protein